MILQPKIRIAFKIISCLVAGIFLFQQVAWASDLIETVLNQQTEAQAQTFAPSYLQTQQTIAESTVSQQQTIENFNTTINATSASSTQQSSDDSSLT